MKIKGTITGRASRVSSKAGLLLNDLLVFIGIAFDFTYAHNRLTTQIADSVSFLEESELIEWEEVDSENPDEGSDRFLRLTDKGKVYLNGLTSLPLPVPKTVWAVPTKE
jgi:hypothetical protein